MRIAIIGSAGMLGREIASKFDSYFNVRCYDFFQSDFSQHILDITNRLEVIAEMSSFRPDVIINCAAYTDVDGAETERTKALNVNYIGVQNLVEVTNLLSFHGTKLIHFSTDYVFDGIQNEYCEEDQCKPINFYGLSKFYGECACYNKCNPRSSLIIRTSWLYGNASDNFVLKIARKLASGEDVSVVCDQFGLPTYAGDLADFVFYLVSNNELDVCSGTIHYTNVDENSKSISWYGFAKQIKEYLYKHCPKSTNSIINIGNVHRITSDELTNKAKRPMNSTLSTIHKSKTDLRRKLFYQRKNWKDSLEKYIYVAPI